MHASDEIKNAHKIHTEGVCELRHSFQRAAGWLRRGDGSARVQLVGTAIVSETVLSKLDTREIWHPTSGAPD